MGRLHWSKHAEKPTPIKDIRMGGIMHHLRLIVRERPDARKSERYVATLRFVKPPRPGQHVLAFCYGRTPDEAEFNVLARVEP